MNTVTGQTTRADDVTKGGQEIRWKTPLAIGTAIGAADYLTRSDDTMPAQLAIDPSRFATAEAAMADPNLRFKPQAQYANVAEGGRIGYARGLGPATRKGLPSLDMDMEWGGPEQIELSSAREEAFEEDPLFASRIMKLEAEHERDVSNYEKDALMNRLHKKYISPLGSVRTEKNYWKALSKAIEAGDQEAIDWFSQNLYGYPRRIAKEEGILAGNSCGSAIAGLMQLKEKLTNKDVVVVIMPDHGSRYIAKIYNDNWMKDQNFI